MASTEIKAYRIKDARQAEDASWAMADIITRVDVLQRLGVRAFLAKSDWYLTLYAVTTDPTVTPSATPAVS